MHFRTPIFSALMLAILAIALPNGAALAQTKLRFVLDWKYQAQMGPFFLAADRGYFKDEKSGSLVRSG